MWNFLGNVLPKLERKKERKPRKEGRTNEGIKE
jgi:hypothetical protein